MGMTMKITGYKLREALKRWEVRKETSASQFDGSLTYFEANDKKDPKEVITSFLGAEANIASLQTEQMRYNLLVKVKVPTVSGEQVEKTLGAVIKLVGGFGRAEKMWRSAASEKKDRYSYGEVGVREAGKLYASRAISFDEAAKRSTEIARVAGAYREAIAMGNATEVDTDLSPALFE